MGGKVWSAEEEKYFWGTIMKNSPKRLGRNRTLRDEWPWNECAKRMHAHFGERARRNYTGLGLCKFFIQLA